MVVVRLLICLWLTVKKLDIVVAVDTHTHTHNTRTHNTHTHTTHTHTPQGVCVSTATTISSF